MRILIIDDNADLLDSLAQVLHSAGYEVATASSARLALEKHRVQLADVLITDILMPDTDGLEAIAAFRAGWPGLKIIAMSGGGRMTSANYLETARLAGADAALRKPFPPNHLLEMLDSFTKQP